MATRQDRERLQRMNEKHKNILATLLAREENKFCADCLSKGPRWASWNLGVLVCIRCSGLHRSMGVHISRVKSVNLDTWTREQMINFCSRGNSWAKEMYEAKLPEHFKRPQTDSNLEYFIRDKYEKKKYMSPVEICLKPLTGLGLMEEESPKKTSKRTTRSKENVSIVSIPKPKGLRAASPGIPRPSSMPQLPQHDDSPVQQPKVQNHTPTPTTDDLLGLSSPISTNAPVSVTVNAAAPTSSDLTEDLFGPMSSFQSSTITSSVSSPDLLNGSVASNQETPEEKVEDKKLSKDSILSLYSQGTKTSPMSTGNFNMTSQASMGYQQQQQQQQPMQYNQHQSFPNMHAGMNMQGMQGYSQQQQQQHQQMMAMQQQQYQMQQMAQQMSGLNMTGMGYSGMAPQQQQQQNTVPNNMGYGMGYGMQPQSQSSQPMYNPMQQQPQAMYSGMANGSIGMPQMNANYNQMQAGMMQNQPNANGSMWGSGTVQPTAAGMGSGHTLSTQLWK